MRGCRAQYDRVRVANSIRERPVDEIEIVIADSEDANLAIVVIGCSTACTKVPHNISRARKMPSNGRRRYSGK